MKTLSQISEKSAPELHSDLIEGCRRGDQKAQFSIYKLYYRPMFNISLRIVKDRAEAEDIMQESFLRAFEDIGSFAGKSSFGAWLRRIVYNRSIDALRKKNRTQFEDVDLLSLESVPDYLYSDRHEERDKRLSLIHEAFKKMSDNYRNIFSLYFIEGYDYSEISDILSIPANTTRSQVSRAKKKLAGYLAPSGKRC